MRRWLTGTHRDSQQCASCRLGCMQKDRVTIVRSKGCMTQEACWCEQSMHALQALVYYLAVPSAILIGSSTCNRLRRQARRL